MNIAVLMKRTFDTEEKITISNGKISDEGVEWIINPYDEYAVEEAISLKEKHGGDVTVITFGEEEAEKQLRTALAMGADRAVLIECEEVEEIDQYTTAKVLAKFLSEREYDLILAGNVAVDGGSGQVGPRVASELEIEHVTSVTKIDIEDKVAIVERDVEGDKEIVEVALPVFLTAQQGLNDPRYPSLPGIMKAKKKPMERIDLDDLGIDEEEIVAKTRTLEIYLPPKKAAGKVLEGEINDQVNELLSLLNSEAKVI